MVNVKFVQTFSSTREVPERFLFTFIGNVWKIGVYHHKMFFSQIPQPSLFSDHLQKLVSELVILSPSGLYTSDDF